MARIWIEEFESQKTRIWTKSFGSEIVQLEPDVAEIFPSADAVNEALRLLIQISQRQPGNNFVTRIE